MRVFIILFNFSSINYHLFSTIRNIFLINYILKNFLFFQFRKLSTTSECLFSLVNGDDMYVTYSSLNANASNAIWYFHRAYLYIFIALFVYVVISVFIAVIMDNYENLKVSMNKEQQLHLKVCLPLKKNLKQLNVRGACRK